MKRRQVRRLTLAEVKEEREEAAATGRSNSKDQRNEELKEEQAWRRSPSMIEVIKLTCKEEEEHEE